MAEYPIYRLVKGDQLTFTEMDNNLRWLSQNMSGSQLTLTGSTIGVTGSMTVTGDIQVTGTASIGFLKSEGFSTGSNQLGNDTLDFQTLVGVVSVSGSLGVSGSTQIPDLTGSLFGTSSWARNSILAVSSSWPVSASSITVDSTGSATSLYSIGTDTDLVANPITVALGWRAGKNKKTLGYDVYVGDFAGYIDNNQVSSSTSMGNTMIGSWAGYNANYSEFSTFVGDAAGAFAPYTQNSVFLGRGAGVYAISSSNSVFIGVNAGTYVTGPIYTTNANYSVFIGPTAGAAATNASESVFLGRQAGQQAYNANNSFFSGYLAGSLSVSASNSIFVGRLAGRNNSFASHSIFLGYQTGFFGSTSLGANNIILGTNISLPSGYANYANIGAILYVSGTYGTVTGNPRTTPVIGSVGINQVNPTFNLDVSGSGRYTNGLTVTGSVIATQSVTASAALINGTITAQTLVVQMITSSIIYSSGSNIFGNQLSNTQTFTGSVKITGSLNVRDIPQGNYGNIVVVDTASGDFYLTASNSVGAPGVLAYIGQNNLYSLTPKAAVPGLASQNSIYIGSGSGAGIADYNSINSLIIGFEAGGGTSNSDASNSTWIGYQAGYNADYAERSILIGYQAGALDGSGGPELNDAIFLGYQAGYSSSYAYESNFFGHKAGMYAESADQSNFLGYYAGYSASDARDSNFFGSSAGLAASQADNSNFLGSSAGAYSRYAEYSNFFGYRTGFQAYSASYSTLIGYKAGDNDTIFQGIGSNNIIIGTNITLQEGRKDSINIGGILFGTGSFADPGALFASSDPVLDGKIGINKSIPTYNLDVSGSGNFTKGLDVTGSLKVSTTTGVFLPPRMTQAQRTALGTPTVGSMVYQTDATEGVYVYTSTGWRSLAMI